MNVPEKSLCAAIFIHNGVTYRVTIREHPGLIEMADRALSNPRKRVKGAGGAMVVEALEKKSGQ